MASKRNTILIFLIISLLALPSRASTVEPAPTPTPTPWPRQFHSLLVVRNNGSLRIVDLWYDWPNGRNFNIIHHQLSYVLYDLEWNNGTSFFYTLDSSRRCSSMQFEVGILRPNWLDGANYLGQRRVDGFLCNVWEKVEFIWYYEDVITKRPVHWVFYDAMEAHVMTLEVGAVLEDEHWQAPVYCFESDDKKSASHPLPLPLPQPHFSSIGNFRNLYSISSDLFSVELGPRQQKFFK